MNSFSKLQAGKSLYKVFKILLLTLTVFFTIHSMVFFTWAQGVEASRDREIRYRTEKILSLEEFSAGKKETTVLETLALGIKDIIESIREKIKSFLDRNNIKGFKVLPFSTALSPAEDITLKILGVAIISAVIVILAWFVSRNLTLSKRIRQKSDAELLAILKDADVVENKAMAFYSEGDYRQAVRFLYLALLLRFNEHNIIRIEKSKTNKEYLRDIKRTDFCLYDNMNELTQDFNGIWYGNRKVERQSFQYCHESYNLLKMEVEK